MDLADIPRLTPAELARRQLELNTFINNSMTSLTVPGDEKSAPVGVDTTRSVFSHMPSVCVGAAQLFSIIFILANIAEFFSAISFWSVPCIFTIPPLMITSASFGILSGLIVVIVLGRKLRLMGLLVPILFIIVIIVIHAMILTFLNQLTETDQCDTSLVTAAQSYAYIEFALAASIVLYCSIGVTCWWY